MWVEVGRKPRGVLLRQPRDGAFLSSLRPWPWGSKLRASQDRPPEPPRCGPTCCGIGSRPRALPPQGSGTWRALLCLCSVLASWAHSPDKLEGPERHRGRSWVVGRLVGVELVPGLPRGLDVGACGCSCHTRPS